MADVSTLVLRLKNGQFNRGLKQSEKGVTKLSGSTFGLKRIIGALGLAFAGKKLFDFGVGATKAAIDAEETANKFATVFESMEFGAARTAKRFAKDFGLASSTAKKLLGDTGDLLVGFGFSEEAALDLSRQVNELAVDLASFTNIEGGASRASQALTKLLVGETEQAKALGIVVRQSTRAYNERVKVIMQTQKLDILQAKALANLEIAFGQSQKAVGDFARTQNSAANVIKRTTEAWKDLREAIGDVILGVLDFGTAGNTLIEKIQSVTQTVRARTDEWVFVFNELRIRLVGIATTIANVFGVAFDVVFKAASNVFKYLAEGFRQVKAGQFDLGALVNQNFEKPLENITTRMAEAVGEPLAAMNKQLKANEKALEKRIQSRIDKYRRWLEERGRQEGKEAQRAAAVTQPGTTAFRLAGAARKGSAEAVRILARTKGQRDVADNTRKTAENTARTARNTDRMARNQMDIGYANLGGQPA